MATRSQFLKCCYAVFVMPAEQVRASAESAAVPAYVPRDLRNFTACNEQTLPSCLTATTQTASTPPPPPATPLPSPHIHLPSPLLARQVRMLTSQPSKVNGGLAHLG